MGDLVPFVKFNKRKKTHGEVLLLGNCRFLASNFIKSNIPPRVFLCFLNCTNDTKLNKASHIENKSNTRGYVKPKKDRESNKTNSGKLNKQQIQ